MDSLLQDKELIERARQGDRASFEILVTRHQRAVFAYLKARTTRHSDIEDMTQEVFLRSYLAKDRFDSGNQLRPWLLGIARNVLREHLRGRRQQETAWTQLCLMIDDMIPPDSSPDDDRLEHLGRCLDSLGPSARSTIDWHYGSGLRLQEIADRLHRSSGAVKILIFRARQALRQCLEGKSADAGPGVLP